jgi:hypothetical protein
MRRSALGARGLCIPGMSCAPGALRLAFVYHFILYSSIVSRPGPSFSAFVWCSPSVNFILICSGSGRPLHRSAKCRSALGARGLCIEPLWERCVDPLWEREAFASIRSGSDVSIRFGSERYLHPGDVMRSRSAAFDLRLPLHPVLHHRFSAWCFVQCFRMVLSFSEFCLDLLWEQEAFASIRSGSDVSIRSGSERPLHQFALGAMCRSALGAKGLCVPGMSCAPGALCSTFVYRFILCSSIVSRPGASFSAFV